MTFCKTLLCASFLIISAGCAHMSEVQHRSFPAKWVLNQGLCEPETVIHDKAKNRLIVSNICGFKRNGEGYLSVLNMDGTLNEARWIDGFNAPAGMAIYGRRLFVTDLDRVQIIDLDRDETSRVLGPFPDAKAFNDIAVGPDETVYVSDSARHKILKIEHGLSEPFPNASAHFQFANGLHFEGDRLVVGGEKLWVVDFRTKDIKTIDIEGLADIDGIEDDGLEGLIVSIVGGDVWHLPANNSPVIWTAPNLSSTNHAYLPDENLVLVPTGYDNTIIAFQPTQ